jgi:hypothetical protein
MTYPTKVSVYALALIWAQMLPSANAQQQPPPAPAPAASAPPSAASIERAAQVLAEARKAMGGDKLAEVTTILTTGRTRRVRGENLVPIEFEIAIELPDKYVRKDEVPAEESEPTSTGFVGREVIQYPAAPAGRAGGPPPAGRAGGPPPAAARPGDAPVPGGKPAAPPADVRPPSDAKPSDVKPPSDAKPTAPPKPMLSPEQMAEQQRNARLLSAKQEFARLALGFFANTLAAYPLTFSYAARAEAPQGSADVLDVKGEGNFAVRLFVHADTHLPIMVSWQAPPTNVIITTPGQPPPKTVAPGAVIVSAPAPPPTTASQEEKDKYSKEVLGLRAKAQATPIEYRLYYADYRDVDGVKFPFRLRRAIATDTTEETTFDRFRLNTKIDPRKFTVPQR